MVPPPSRRVLAHTSVFMIVPFLTSTDPLFTMCIALTCAFSVLHWGKYRVGSVYQALDRAFSAMTIGILVCRSSILVPLPVLLGFFLAGRYCHNRGLFDYHLPLHLTFRGVAFWWCCHYCDHLDPATFAVYILIYIAQAYYIYSHEPTHRHVFVQKQEHKN